jgi:hypothetical protein
MKKYSVGLFDCAGEFAGYDTDSFDEVLAMVAKWERQYPSKVVRVANNDRADYDTCGLTEDESDAIDAASASAGQ